MSKIQQQLRGAPLSAAQQRTMTQQMMAAQGQAAPQQSLSPAQLIHQNIQMSQESIERIGQQITQEQEQQKMQMLGTMNQIVFLKIQNAKDGYMIEDIIEQAKSETTAIVEASRSFKEEIDVQPHPMLVEQKEKLEKEAEEFMASLEEAKNATTLYTQKPEEHDEPVELVDASGNNVSHTDQPRPPVS